MKKSGNLALTLPGVQKRTWATFLYHQHHHAGETAIHSLYSRYHLTIFIERILIIRKYSSCADLKDHARWSATWKKKLFNFLIRKLELLLLFSYHYVYFRYMKPYTFCLKICKSRYHHGYLVICSLGSFGYVRLTFWNLLCEIRNNGHKQKPSKLKLILSN